MTVNCSKWPLEKPSWQAQVYIHGLKILEKILLINVENNYMRFAVFVDFHEFTVVNYSILHTSVISS
jgi:hypothetical protein